MSKATVQKALKTMDAYLVEACNENIMPGLAVGVVHQGELVYSKSFGLALSNIAVAWLTIGSLKFPFPKTSWTEKILFIGLGVIYPVTPLLISV